MFEQVNLQSLEQIECIAVVEMNMNVLKQEDWYVNWFLWSL